MTELPRDRDGGESARLEPVAALRLARPLGSADEELTERLSFKEPESLESRDKEESRGLRRARSSRGVRDLSSVARPISEGFGRLGGLIPSSASAGRFLPSGEGGLGGRDDFMGGFGGRLQLVSGFLGNFLDLSMVAYLMSTMILSGPDFCFPVPLGSERGGLAPSGLLVVDSDVILMSGPPRDSEFGVAEARSIGFLGVWEGVWSRGDIEAVAPVVFLFL